MTLEALFWSKVNRQHEDGCWVTTNPDIMVALADAKNRASSCIRLSVGASINGGVEDDAL